MSGKGKSLLAALVTISAFAVFCGKDSNMVSAPVASPLASVTGTWTGAFASSTVACAGTPMTATLAQNGSEVTGNVTSPASCGLHGNFKATMVGSALTGTINMEGCLGGGVSGQLQNGVLSLAIGDFYRPLVTGNQVIIEGGSANLKK